MVFFLSRFSVTAFLQHQRTCKGSGRDMRSNLHVPLPRKGFPREGLVIGNPSVWPSKWSSLRPSAARGFCELSVLGICLVGFLLPGNGSLWSHQDHLVFESGTGLTWLYNRWNWGAENQILALGLKAFQKEARFASWGGLSHLPQSERWPSWGDLSHLSQSERQPSWGGLSHLSQSEHQPRRRKRQPSYMGRTAINTN